MERCADSSSLEVEGDSREVHAALAAWRVLKMEAGPQGAEAMAEHAGRRTMESSDNDGYGYQEVPVINARVVGFTAA